MTVPNTRILIIAEGQSDKEFINKVIVPDFVNIGVWLTPILMNTSKTQKGGGISFERFKKIFIN